MKHKYIDEKYGNWFIFGASGKGVDVESSTQGTLATVKPGEAFLLIEAYDQVLNALANALVELSNHDPETANKILDGTYEAR